MGAIIFDASNDPIPKRKEKPTVQSSNWKPKQTELVSLKAVFNPENPDENIQIHEKLTGIRPNKQI